MAGVAAMSMYHRYRMYQSMMMYGGYGSYGMGMGGYGHGYGMGHHGYGYNYGHNPYGMNGGRRGFLSSDQFQCMGGMYIDNSEMDLCIFVFAKTRFSTIQKANYDLSIALYCVFVTIFVQEENFVYIYVVGNGVTNTSFFHDLYKNINILVLLI